MTEVSHSSGSVSPRLGLCHDWILVRAMFWATDSRPLIVFSCGSSERGSELSLYSSKGTNPIPEGCTFMTSSNSNYLQKSHLLTLSHGGGGNISTKKTGGSHRHSVHNILIFIIPSKIKISNILIIKIKYSQSLFLCSCLA